jgi:hypothetical protein
MEERGEIGMTPKPIGDNARNAMMLIDICYDFDMTEREITETKVRCKMLNHIYTADARMCVLQQTLRSNH